MLAAYAGFPCPALATFTCLVTLMKRTHALEGKQYWAG
jgi:hypothetical protein